MEYTRLVNNIIDVIKEEQIKLGYRSEVIRLYYPLQSLNHFLDSDVDSSTMATYLSDFFNKGNSVLGQVNVSYQKERFCLLIPAHAIDYVHEHTKENEFIREFIETIQVHGCTIEQLLEVFNKHSQSFNKTFNVTVSEPANEFNENVHFESVTHREFDYLIYFENEQPDNYRYCITDEGCHLIYHRFTPEDYIDFRFS